MTKVDESSRRRLIAKMPFPQIHHSSTISEDSCQPVWIAQEIELPLIIFTVSVVNGLWPLSRAVKIAVSITGAEVRVTVRKSETGGVVDGIRPNRQIDGRSIAGDDERRGDWTVSCIWVDWYVESLNLGQSRNN